ncbi:MAG TPA: hypothetical protein QF490_03580, partial [Candidatus Thalassarchaeaceae archaeon]|nr:hypothetical protein [Candidatus Thalassarchaeaceae archaeon]
MRDFTHVADFLVPRSRQSHFIVLVISVLMLPGLLATFSPIDIESYSLESPELDANEVLREEFTAAGNLWAFGIFVRDSEHFGEA